ncbi:5'-3' exoribonuclease pacman isoform X2 [Lycorma delicatula]|uniref:5'-3' exoribonuclease pacman isoform X2 n=1 Tax=Lycorma delicatula TaxID=130591 RepID=UPI003F515D77
MGVPKFFRYISERYPCLSELVQEHQIPEFDHLYLDMNGIIHVCSHPNDFDPHFRISEKDIFSDIFHYIEILFRMIQPKRLFFMAVDGVAPRAKMNQQRGRRFRSAKDAEVLEAKARASGEVLPDVERFDSNCITPGTIFMARLHAQLRYFVNYKISTDKLWQKPTIILSGHETPGEGEHKIMDYIRYLKSKPDYDPNTRHCLYGLDADLIMLGLCTHEPHFSLLREEVKFSKSSKDKHHKRASVPEEIRFYLLHLSLMREYIDLEFQELKTTLSFSYNLENIIDDWVLMGFLVGNDFIPHLPNLHINNGALPILYKAYIDILPTVGGYINEGGKLNLMRFQKYMDKLAGFDLSQFRDIYADLKYFQGKTGRRPNEKERTSYKITGEGSSKNEDTVSVKDPDLAALIQSTNIMLADNDCDNDELDIYYSSNDEDDGVEDALIFAEFHQHKNDYYVNKLEYDKVTTDVLRLQAEGYVRAIQWNLNYYYNGCCSWSWFYPHHYAPFISDITDFKNIVLEFELGEPFLPFQQLLAVLPAASKKLLPEPFQELMVNEDSPIIDFYPTDFKTDMNGKKHEWEALVLIPFINEDSLLSAMATKYDRLTDEEKRRNCHGPMLVYKYTPENQGVCEAPEYFPTLSKCYAKEEHVNREDIVVEVSKLVKGLCPGVKLDVFFPGFPTFKHLKFTAKLKKAKVKVFDNASRGDNMILKLKENSDLTGDLTEISEKLLDKVVFVNWPHLQEAKVIAIANEKKRILSKQCADGSSTMITENLVEDIVEQLKLSKRLIEEKYLTRMGIDCSKTEVVVYASVLEGRKYAFTNNSRVSYEKKVSEGGKNGRIKLSVCVTSEPDLQPAIEVARRTSSSFLTGHSMAQRLGISSHLLSRITGSIFVVDVEPGASTETAQKTNIGLNLKFNKKNEEVCGYTKKENGQWFYSMKAGQLINDYLKIAPDVISYIASNVLNDIFYAREIFPENSSEQLKKLVSWLHDQDFMKAERLRCGSKVLEEEVVSVIEKVIEYTKNRTGKTVIMQIKPHLLLLPKTSGGGLPADPTAVHKLFDRIVCVRDSYTVPLGYKGTITGIKLAEKEDNIVYDVVFDKEFVGGIQIRCSSNRGYRMNDKCFINLSHGIRLENSKSKSNVSVNVQQPEYDRFDNYSWNSRRNSAFASCNNNNNNNNNNNKNSIHKSQQQPPKQRLHSFDAFTPKSASNAQKEDKHKPLADQANTNQPSSEFQAMWNELKKAGTKPSQSQIVQGQAAVSDASDVLKKMLKIADSSPKRKSVANAPPRDIRKCDDEPVPNQKEKSYVQQLEDYLKYCNMQKPLYTYNNEDFGGTTLLIGNVVLEIQPEVIKTFVGKPSPDYESAAESAAFSALSCLKLEDDNIIIKQPKQPPQHHQQHLQEGIIPLLSSGNGVGSPNNMYGARQMFPSSSNMYSTLSNRIPPMVFGNNLRQPSNYQQPFRNPNNSNNSSRGKTSFSWFNTDLPTPPQQWYKGQQQSNVDARHMDRKPRQDQGGGPNKLYQPQSYYNNQQQHNYSYSRPNIGAQCNPGGGSVGVGSVNVTNFKNRSAQPIVSGNAPVGQMPFIPLQAITQCRTRPSTCSNFISRSMTDSSQSQESAKPIDSSPGNNIVTNQSRPPTVLSHPRKSRIAAKFNVNID